jgi:CubicO group peptidase (beta-lactamase class C family)
MIGIMPASTASGGSREIEPLDAVVRAPVEEGAVAGITAVVLRGGSAVYAGAHGVADVDAGAPMHPDTALRLASVAKTATGVLAVRLASSGRPDLDAPLSRALPELDDVLSPRVTLRAVLGNTSGLRDYLARDLERFDHTRGPLAEDFVLDAVRGDEPHFEPGTHWAYTNTGYYLAALAMCRATGLSWSGLVQDELAAPLGLESLQPCDALIEEGRLHGYRREGAAFVGDPCYGELGVMGDGGLCATAADLAVLARGVERGDLLTPAARGQLLAPVVLADGTAIDYGLGVRHGELAGHRMWGNTGSFDACVAAVFRFPDDDVTVSVVQNTTNAAQSALTVAGKLAERALGLGRPAPALPGHDARISLCAGEYMSWGEAPHPVRTRISAADGGLTRARLDRPGRETVLTSAGPHLFTPAGRPRDRVRFHMSGDRAIGYSEYQAGLFAEHHWRVPQQDE